MARKQPEQPAAAEQAQQPTTTPSVPAGQVLVLRTCTAEMTGIHNHKKAKAFVWPEAGPVECDDWRNEPECGHGLHGLLWGEGDGGTLSWEADAKWLVVAVPEGSTVDLAGKVKFPRGEVVFCGDRLGATEYLRARAPGRAIVGGTATAGDDGTATAGYAGTATAGARGTATAGDAGTATAGYAGTATAGARGTATAGARGTATAGDDGTATAGDAGTATAGARGTATAGYAGTATAGARGTATAGDAGTATAGDDGTATAGDDGTATAGYAGTATAGARGTATAGDAGTATAGDAGTATAGARGTATAGDDGTATAGDDGVLVLRWYDGKRYRIATFYVGDEGIEPNQPYKVDEKGKALKVEKKAEAS